MVLLPTTIYLFPPILMLLFAFSLPYLLSNAWQLILFQASEEENYRRVVTRRMPFKNTALGCMWNTRRVLI